MLVSHGGKAQSVAANPALANVPPQKTAALTFDDLPAAAYSQNPDQQAIREMQAMTTGILATLRKHQAPAVGFVNEIKMNTPGARDPYAALLEQWLAAGMDLGNHGYSHLQFSDVGFAAYAADFYRGDVITALLMKQHGKTEHFFRYPYNDTGDALEKKTAFFELLEANHYQIAPMTIENDDWLYSVLYVQAVADKDAGLAARLRAGYLEETRRKIAYAEQLSEREFHRQLPQVVNLHANALNADALEDLLVLFEQRGYHFVSLDQAVGDPAYLTPDTFVGRAGISWLERWLPDEERGAALHADPDPPAWVLDAYKKWLDSHARP